MEYNVEYRAIPTILNNLRYHCFIIIKFNLYVIRYKFHSMTGFIHVNTNDITRCPDYARYKKWYRLLYGV